jgi:uncharacterized protein (DUF433 family)
MAVASVPTSLAGMRARVCRPSPANMPLRWRGFVGSLPLCWKAGTLPEMNAERLKRITVEEGKCGGRPCIRGLRIRVSDVLDLLAAGATFEEILADYPFLENEDILAAVEYAARQADHVVLQAR